jgi:hypothetical protein
MEFSIMTFIQATRRVMQLTLLGAALSSPLPAFAAPPTPAAMATAVELVKMTGATALFNTLVPGVIEQSKLLFLQQNPGLAGDLNEIAAKMRADLAPRLSELYAEVGKIYAEQFTEQELKELATFFNSQVGKKYVAEQSVVVNASLKFAQDWATKLSDEVTIKMREELKKKGHAL